MLCKNRVNGFSEVKLVIKWVWREIDQSSSSLNGSIANSTNKEGDIRILMEPAGR